MGATARLALPDEVVPADFIAALAALPSVSQIKLSHGVLPATVDVRHAPADGPAPGPARLPAGLTGEGVVVGVVDYGCDLLHPSLRARQGGGTRLLALWDQRGRGPAPGDLSNEDFEVAVFNYGREFLPDQINAALETFDVDKDQASFYQVTCDPHAHYYDPGHLGEGCHGTHVASVAAGTPMSTALGQFQGVAPGAGLVFVNLGIDVDDWRNRSLDPPTKAFADNGCLVDAIKYVVCRGLRLRQQGHPVDGIVVNVSLGSWAGAHDGQSMVELAIDEVVAALDGLPDPDLPMISVVVAAGNAALLDGHGQGRVDPGETAAVHWLVPPGASGCAELEIWYRSPAPPRVTVMAPAAFDAAAAVVAAGTTGFVRRHGREMAVATHRAPDGERPGQIHVVVDPGHANTPPDRKIDTAADPKQRAWIVSLALAADVADPLTYHCWIEREIASDGEASSLLASQSRSILGSIACGEHPVVVGAFNSAQPRRADGRLSPFWPTSQGPRPWTDATPLVPHISAPGQSILCARSHSLDLTASPSGSSLAAAHATGGVALLMEALARAGLRRSAAEIHDGLIEAARRNSLAAGGRPERPWDPGQGYGPLDVAGAISILTQGSEAA